MNYCIWNIWPENWKESIILLGVQRTLYEGIRHITHNPISGAKQRSCKMKFGHVWTAEQKSIEKPCFELYSWQEEIEMVKYGEWIEYIMNSWIIMNQLGVQIPSCPEWLAPYRGSNHGGSRPSYRSSSARAIGPLVQRKRLHPQVFAVPGRSSTPYPPNFEVQVRPCSTKMIQRVCHQWARHHQTP